MTCIEIHAACEGQETHIYFQKTCRHSSPWRGCATLTRIDGLAGRDLLRLIGGEDTTAARMAVRDILASPRRCKISRGIKAAWAACQAANGRYRARLLRQEYFAECLRDALRGNDPLTATGEYPPVVTFPRAYARKAFHGVPESTLCRSVVVRPKGAGRHLVFEVWRGGPKEAHVSWPRTMKGKMVPPEDWRALDAEFVLASAIGAAARGCTVVVIQMP